jgi:phosphatidylserine decarboxylase
MEGIPFILAGAVSAFVISLLHWYFLAILFLLLTLFVIFFFRNPARRVPDDERAIVAPADGVVIYLGPAREECTGETLTKVSIFMSVFNVHINRVPVSATVVDSYYRQGSFFDVRDHRAPLENERRGLILATATGLHLVVVQIAGLIARRIVCYPKVGALLKTGERYGLIRFGSRLDIYLPPQVTIAVKDGQKTVAGETILGYLP